MTSRKPKLNLLYVADASSSWLQPRLQLAIVTPEPISVQQRHAMRWQAGRGLGLPVDTVGVEGVVSAGLRH